MPRLALLLMALACLLAGCSSKPPPVDETELNLRRIAQAYDLASEPHGIPPRNEDQLKRQFKNLRDLREPDQILRSPRDGQPFVILFGVPLDAGERSTILAYEKDGKDGTRYVLLQSRDIKVLPDDEFASADFAGGHHRPHLGGDSQP